MSEHSHNTDQLLGADSMSDAAILHGFNTLLHRDINDALNPTAANFAEELGDYAIAIMNARKTPTALDQALQFIAAHYEAYMSYTHPDADDSDNADANNIAQTEQAWDIALQATEAATDFVQSIHEHPNDFNVIGWWHGDALRKVVVINKLPEDQAASEDIEPIAFAWPPEKPTA